MKNENLKKMAKIAKLRIGGEYCVSKNIGCEQFLKSDETARLTDKIFYVLENRKDSLTPLGDIINFEEFNKMSSAKKEIYIFNLIEKYNFYKNKLDSSKQIYG